jgi:hypothetical protein
VVKVKGDVTPEKLALLRHGLELDGRKLKPAEVEQVKAHELRFVLHEGRNRQIRRMCQLVDSARGGPDARADRLAGTGGPAGRQVAPDQRA